jgi:uncharacterized small protein (DUF1192 family)
MKSYIITTYGPDEIVYREFYHEVLANSEEEAIQLYHDGRLEGYIDCQALEYYEVNADILTDLLNDHTHKVISVKELADPNAELREEIQKQIFELKQKLNSL